MEKLEEIKSYCDNGYNCAQSVLAAYSEDYGLKKELAFKLTQSLGVGVAFKGEVCGAVLSALIVYGLKFGSEELNNELAGEVVHKLSKEHIDEFEDIHESILCKDLIGYDFSIPEELNMIMEQDLFKWKCSAFIKDSVNILNGKIAKTEKQLNRLKVASEN